MCVCVCVCVCVFVCVESFCTPSCHNRHRLPGTSTHPALTPHPTHTHTHRHTHTHGHYTAGSALVEHADDHGNVQRARRRRRRQRRVAVGEYGCASTAVLVCVAGAARQECRCVYAHTRTHAYRDLPWCLLPWLVTPVKNACVCTYTHSHIHACLHGWCPR